MRAVLILVLLLPLSTWAQDSSAPSLPSATASLTTPEPNERPDQEAPEPGKPIIATISPNEAAAMAPDVERGWSSWYGKRFHGRKTASGERFDMNALTAAHRSLPLHTYVKVTVLETGAQVIARINDRGPYAKDRIIDLSQGAARALGLLQKGLAEVLVEPLFEK